MVSLEISGVQLFVFVGRTVDFRALAYCTEEEGRLWVQERIKGMLGEEIKVRVDVEEKRRYEELEDLDCGILRHG